MLISVVFSFRNEEEVLSELIRRVTTVMSEIGDYELIFVNDYSTDRSESILIEEQNSNPQIRILNMARRFGVSPCVMAGLAAAKGDAVVYMDSDLQDPPELIIQMVAKWQGGAAVVHTVRTKRHGETRLKMWLTSWAYRTINMFSDIDLIENAGDFKLLSRQAVNEILRLEEHDPYMRGLSIWIGFQQAFVPYERDPRHSGVTKFGLFCSLNPYKEFIRGLTSFSAAPLYFALFVGFLVSIVSFGMLAFVVVTKLRGLNLPGWSALMVTNLFLGGVILLTIGILGIYVGKIYDLVKRRPRYIVKNRIEFGK